MQRQQYIKLEECVNDYLSESEQGIQKYFKLYHIGYRGLQELGLDFFYNVKSVKLPINPNLTVYLPEDYLNYTKIGVLNERGEIIPLTYNKNLTTYADLLPNRIEKTQDDTLFNLWSPTNGVFYNYWGDGIFSNLYGIPSGTPFVGSFKVDNGAGVILLDEYFSYSYLMLEYLASPVADQDYWLPVQFREAVISYLRWKDIISMPNSRRGSLGDKEQRRREFFNDRRLAIARWKPIYIEDAYQASQEQTRMTVKI